MNMLPGDFKPSQGGEFAEKGWDNDHAMNLCKTKVSNSIRQHLYSMKYFEILDSYFKIITLL